MLATLRQDVQAVRDRDSAARSTLHIVLCSPGLHAIWGRARRGRPFRLGRDADRGPREHGRRGRLDHALDAGDHHQHLQRPARAPARDRGRAATSGAGIALGPIVAGLLLPHFAWGSVFLINVPIAAAGFALALALVADSKNPAAQRPDLVGSLLSIAGLGLVLYAIIEAPMHGWTSALVLTTGVGGLAILAASSRGSGGASTRCSIFASSTSRAVPGCWPTARFVRFLQPEAADPNRRTSRHGLAPGGLRRQTDQAARCDRWPTARSR